MSQRILTSVELFAGAGGLALGIERAGFKHLAVVEKLPVVCETLRHNTDWPIVCGDVSVLDHGHLRDTVDLLAGGPPCQPFSVAGKHRAHLDPRDMFPEAIRAVRELRPRAFVLENVRGLLRNDFSDYFRCILQQLRNPQLTTTEGETWASHLSRLENEEPMSSNDGSQYRVSYKVLNAADYGTPQRRERLFIVGIRSDMDREWTFPSPTHSLEALLWSQFKSGEYWRKHGITPLQPNYLPPRLAIQANNLTERPSLSPWTTVRDALTDLPNPKNQEDSQVISGHKLIPGAKTYEGHTGSHRDLPAKTLKAGVHGVPGGENTLHEDDGSVRYFTIRECARLQGFPDSYHFPSSWGATMRQLGNAVPINLAHRLGLSLADILGRRDSR